MLGNLHLAPLSTLLDRINLQAQHVAVDIAVVTSLPGDVQLPSPPWSKMLLIVVSVFPQGVEAGFHNAFIVEVFSAARRKSQAKSYLKEYSGGRLLICELCSQ